ncbi:alanine/glycine:cation symporter family protein [Gilvimarinus sp. F26214L]|uniref:alanine/glycine:cation symporter family protein n=1 Tax=Gilvimarinus sp. DZF01 TaxID=3461371 RepID=UPI0040462612
MDFLNQLNSFAWGPWMLALILGTGSFLMILLRAIPLRKIGYAFRQLARGGKGRGEGEISPFQALMTSLSATIGTGNIAGVATAIGLGGPGALFWMWCSALVGMATKYAEAVCAVHFRETDEDGQHVGGPMYYIKNGLGRRWLWLGSAFAIFGAVAGFGIGNAVQANSVADALETAFGLNKLLVGLVLMVLVGLVLIGGIRRIAHVASAVVPFMGITYLLAGLWVLGTNISEIPSAIALVFHSAFNPVAAEGGFAGAAVAMAIRYGVARGVFSNEAGLGSAPIAHAAAKTDNPVRQGMIAMLGTLIDTLIICSVTGLAIIVTGAWKGGAEGVAMSQAAFLTAIPYGDKLVSISLIFFAFTTILGWSYYGERCAQYLFGTSVEMPFRIVWVLMVPVGAFAVGLDMVWNVADTLNGFMAVPNLIALLLLSGVVARLTREHFQSERRHAGPVAENNRT